MKLYVIMGGSGSGKSTLAKTICEEMKLPRIKTNTTRPRRDGEGDDDYNFIDNSKWNELVNSDSIVGERNYMTYLGKDGGDLLVHYGVSKKDLVDGGVIITDLNGFLDIHNYVGVEDVVGIQLNLTKDELRERAKKRSDYTEQEFNRRYKADEPMLNENRIDYITTSLTGCKIFKLNGSDSIEEWLETFKQIYIETK